MNTAADHRAPLSVTNAGQRIVAASSMLSDTEQWPGCPYAIRAYRRKDGKASDLRLGRGSCPHLDEASRSTRATAPPTSTTPSTIRLQEPGELDHLGRHLADQHQRAGHELGSRRCRTRQLASNNHQLLLTAQRRTTAPTPKASSLDEKKFDHRGKDVSHSGRDERRWRRRKREQPGGYRRRQCWSRLCRVAASPLKTCPTLPGSTARFSCFWKWCWA